MTMMPEHPETLSATAAAADPGAATAVTSPPPPRVPTVQQALEARDALAYALEQAGIRLPAMDIRTPWADDRECEHRYALVHLGVCSPPVAHALADAIMKGAVR